MEFIAKIFHSVKADEAKIVYLFLGAIFTIIGSLVSFFATGTITLIKHWLDQRAKRTERQYQLLKNVYLEAYEHVSGMMAFLGSLAPDSEGRLIAKPTEKFRDFVTHNGKFSLDKLELIASNKVQTHHLKFIEEYTEQYNYLELELCSLYQLQFQLNDLQHKIDLEMNSVKFWQDATGKELEKPEKGLLPDQSLIDKYSTLAEKSSEKIEELTTARDDLNAQYNIKYLDFEAIKRERWQAVSVACDAFCLSLKEELDKSLADQNHNMLILRRSHSNKIAELNRVHNKKLKGFVSELEEYAGSQSTHTRDLLTK